MQRFVKVTLSHEKGPSLGENGLADPRGVVRTHKNSRVDLKKRQRDKSDAPAEKMLVQSI